MKDFSNKKDIENKLDLLIKKDEEFVAIISGKWGIGKTYFWKEYSKKYNKDKDVVYVSLFGLNSIEDIKEKILLELANHNREYYKKIKNVLKDIKITGISVGGFLSLFSNEDFQNIIICFDDFERLSNKISLKDVLGFVSQLKEQKKCKIIMILNEQELNKLTDIEGRSYSQIMSLYKEKIVDYEFPFIYAGPPKLNKKKQIKFLYDKIRI